VFWQNTNLGYLNGAKNFSVGDDVPAAPSKYAHDTNTNINSIFLYHTKSLVIFTLLLIHLSHLCRSNRGSLPLYKIFSSAECCGFLAVGVHFYCGQYASFTGLRGIFAVSVVRCGCLLAENRGLNRMRVGGKVVCSIHVKTTTSAENRWR